MLLTFRDAKVELRTRNETFEIGTGYIQWAQKMGIISEDFLSIAQGACGDVYFVPY
jgi:hypothetical protein